jgi:putative ABC transport system permease protein
MFRNNLKIALRSLTRHKLYSLINILGMGFGITCFLFIALYAIDELTFDAFHSKKDRIYRVVQHQQLPDESEKHFGAVSYNIANAAKNDLSGVEESVKLFMWGRATVREPESDRGFHQPFITAENSFFKIFDFPFIAGDPTTALAEPNAIVLTESFAKKLFKEENPLGRIVKNDRGMDLKVTALLKDLPKNSHIQFESLISYQTLAPMFADRVKNDWSSQNWGTYVLLEEGTNAAQIGKQLTTMATERASEQRPFEGELALQTLADIHFGSANFSREINAGKSTYTYLYLFGLIGLFILGIAAINYINLATARAGNYSKEVGVRKVVGAGKQQLYSRFLSESFLVTFFALILALVLVQTGLPWFNTFVDKALTLNINQNFWLLPTICVFLVTVTLLAGSYPAAYLSRFKPVAVLKGDWKTNKSGHGLLRKGLVVLQFSLSILMIIGTLIVWKQLNFVQDKKLGFNQDRMVVVDINSGKVRNGFDIIKNGYAQLPGVEAVSVSSRVPGEWKNLLQAEIRPAGAISEKGKTPWFIGADEQFLETFKIDLVSGRNFAKERLGDSTAVILNESAALALGVEEASEQELFLYSRINNGSERPLNSPVRIKVIGIVKDFHFQSLYNKVEPLVLAYRNNPIQAIDYFTARISSENVEQTIAQMGDILQKVDPNQLFEYHFLDEQIGEFYAADKKRGQLFTTAALCAIFIACLGLFGLATFMAEQKAKEIGIRKVLGASVISIIGMLSKDFLKLVLIALVIASPLAWYAMSEWLENFAYRIDVQLSVFLLAGVLALLVAFFTVSYQSLKAALANPVKAIKSE